MNNAVLLIVHLNIPRVLEFKCNNRFCLPSLKCFCLIRFSNELCATAFPALICKLHAAFDINLNYIELGGPVSD